MKKPPTTFSVTDTISASDTINRCLLFIAGKSQPERLAKSTLLRLFFGLHSQLTAQLRLL
jgi:hypothetical protein